MPCTAWTFFDIEGSVECKMCENGYFSADTENFQCSLCPTGTYANKTGSGLCEPCQKGTFNNKIGSILIFDCFACPSDTNSHYGFSECYKYQGNGGDSKISIKLQKTQVKQPNAFQQMHTKLRE